MRKTKFEIFSGPYPAVISKVEEFIRLRLASEYSVEWTIQPSWCAAVIKYIEEQYA